MSQNETVVDIVGFNTLEHVFECLAKFNAGSERVILRAYGGNLSKGVEIARILHKEVGIKIEKSKLDAIKIDDSEVPFIEIPLKAEKTNLDRKDNNDVGEMTQDFEKIDFINYSTYHLLLDWHLQNAGGMRILSRDQRGNAFPLLDIQNENGTRKYDIYKVEGQKTGREEIDKHEVNYALSRSGLLMPGKWKEIANMLSRYDDIILGLDTNILHHCTVTRHLMPAVSLIEPKEYVHTPNWILLVVPSTVMYELEEATNIRDDIGLLVHKGRMGFRSLQEILVLSENIDIPGISLLIYGETNPILDTRGALTGIRKDIYRIASDLQGRSQYPFKISRKSSSGDMAIRYQFKKFLSQIDFHKGTFFLTADKSCSVLAMAEGLHPIYISYANLCGKNVAPPIRVPEGKGNDDMQLSINAPLGNIIYELAVSFGEVIISCKNLSPSIECDRKGESLDRWVHKQLRISKNDLLMLLKNYSGRFNLSKAAGLLRKMTKQFESIEWLSEMGGAFRCD